MKPTRSWIVIADGAQARILENHGPGKGLVTLPAGVMQTTSSPSRDIDTDRPGRGYNQTVHHHTMDHPRNSHHPDKHTYTHPDRPGPGYNPMGQHHTMDSPSDSHREEKRRFADLLANHINAAALDRSYDRLILVAPPKTLGDLRQSLSKEAAAKLDGELPKDLTKVADHDLPAHLGSVIAV